MVGLPALHADHGQTEVAQPVEKDRRHAPSLEHDAMTTWRFRQFGRDRLGRRCRLALANYHAFAIENANMRLVHRNIEASKIVHLLVASSTSWPTVSAFAQELPTLTR